MSSWTGSLTAEDHDDLEDEFEDDITTLDLEDQFDKLMEEDDE